MYYDLNEKIKLKIVIDNNISLSKPKKEWPTIIICGPDGNIEYSGNIHGEIRENDVLYHYVIFVPTKPGIYNLHYNNNISIPNDIIINKIFEVKSELIVT